VLDVVADGLGADAEPLGDAVVRQSLGQQYQHVDATLLANATLGGTVPPWEWIGEGATTFRY
jgi:hypothetical protein